MSIPVLVPDAECPNYIGSICWPQSSLPCAEAYGFAQVNQLQHPSLSMKVYNSYRMNQRS